MNKIPTVFLRNPENLRELLAQVRPDCQWVLDGEGVARRKYDGTCVMLDEDGHWWARREIKPGKPFPDGYRAVETDPETGKTVGWEHIIQSSYYKFWDEVITSRINVGDYSIPGTYELCGPKINGNPEKFLQHILVKHSDAEVLKWTSETYDFESFSHMLQYLSEKYGWEGVVWHHPDGRMAKLKARDFR